MALIDYPSSLPGILINSFNAHEVPHFSANDVQSGAPINELESDTTSFMASLSWSFSYEEKAVFDAWFKDDLNFGTEPFNMLLPVGSGLVSHECRFSGRVRESLNGKRNHLSASIVANELIYQEECSALDLLKLMDMTCSKNQCEFFDLFVYFGEVALPDAWGPENVKGWDIDKSYSGGAVSVSADKKTAVFDGISGSLGDYRGILSVSPLTSNTYWESTETIQSNDPNPDMQTGVSVASQDLYFIGEAGDSVGYFTRYDPNRIYINGVQDHTVPLSGTQGTTLSFRYTSSTRLVEVSDDAITWYSVHTLPNIGQNWYIGCSSNGLYAEITVAFVASDFIRTPPSGYGALDA